MAWMIQVNGFLVDASFPTREIHEETLLTGLIPYIHYSIRGGWVWNLWGRTCVIVHFNNSGTLRIGTNDAEYLVRFLEGKISE